MMKALSILGFILCVYCSMQGQQMTDTISIEKRQVARFYQDGKRLKPGQLVLLTKPNKGAYREMLIAKRKAGTAGFFGFVGGFIIGWQLVSTIQSKPAPWEVTAVGVGAIIASIPFSHSYSKHAVRAVELYNGGLKDTSLGYEKVEMGIVGNGVGMRLVF